MTIQEIAGITDMNKFIDAVSSVKTLAELKELYREVTVFDAELGYEVKTDHNPRKDVVFDEVTHRVTWDGLEEGEEPSDNADYKSAARDFLNRD